MNLVKYCVFCSVLIVSTDLAAQSDSGRAQPLLEKSADLVLTQGKIFTPEGWHTALAVKANVIMAIGDAAEIAELVSETTRVVSLDGGTVLPGLHDMHVHPALAGFEEMSCKISHESQLSEILEKVTACVSNVSNGQWVRGRAYDPEVFIDGGPHKSILDKVSGDNPVLLNDISGHSAWVNTRALELVGYTKDTPDPEGGIIERDENGEPTGLLHESAMGPVYAIIPDATREVYAEATRWALGRMLANGITSLVDASTSAKEARAYTDLYDKGLLKQRVRACLWAENEGLVEQRNQYLRDRFKPDCVKIFLDGVPTDSHTAAMIEPYIPRNDQKREGREKGILMIPPAELNDQVRRYDAMGLVVKFHSAGDQAVRTALDAIELARREGGFNGLRHNPGHTTFIQSSDLRRAREIGATIEFSPYLFSPSPIVVNISKAIGEMRMRRMYAIREALDSGVHTVVGSDWPVTPFVNPWIAVETMVTRQVPGGSDNSTAPQQAVTVREAVDLLTIDAARQLNMASYTGSLEVGKLADMIVVDRNVFEIPITDVHKTRTLLTIIDGEEVWRLQAELKELRAKIGELAVERDFLQRAFDR